MTTKSKVRNVLHPIIGIFLGHWWLSQFGGFTKDIVGNCIVAGLWGTLCIGLIGAFYELFEQKYAEATPSNYDVLSIAIGGAIGGILCMIYPNVLFFEYGFYISLLVGLLDAIMIIRNYNKKKK